VETGDFAEVYATHHGEAMRLAFLLCGDQHWAEDAVSEAFAKVFRQWQRHRIVAVRPYLRRAVVNEVNSRFRSLRLERRERQRRRGDHRGGRPADEQVAAEDQMLAALQVLPPRMRTAVVLRYYHDLSEAETAETMGVSVGTVKSSTSRGLAKLQELLAEEVG
jgi:RNA polymerase sigma-70 factor (sigma-E family)